jgi:hypothetical protein
MKLAEAAVSLLDLLTQEWGRWNMAPDHRDPTFDAKETTQKYKELDGAMLAAEQSLSMAQQRILGRSSLHPGERILSVTTFNPPLKVQARTAQESPTAARGAAPKSFPNVIDYAKLDLENPGEAAEAALAAAPNLTGEDALVLQAWSGALSNLVAAAREVDRSAKALADARILNGATVAKQGPVSVSQQFVNRRGLANNYGSAVAAWGQRVSGLSGQYLGDLYRSNVSPERSQVERERLSAATADQVKLQLKICAVEREVALGYNRAVTALETWQQYASMPQPGSAVNNSTIPTRKLPWEAATAQNSGASQYSKQFAEQSAKIEALERSIQELRQGTPK